MPGSFKEWKACLMEIEQTAHQLETNAHANFPMAENAAYRTHALLGACAYISTGKNMSL